ncbi:transposase [Streptomyces sp. PRKS01-65]|nr:transposase [Streptomyces harenosi]
MQVEAGTCVDVFPMTHRSAGSDRSSPNEARTTEAGWIGSWRGFDQVERAVFQWVAWYNGERLHSALGYISSDEFEQSHWKHQGAGPTYHLITRSRVP